MKRALAALVIIPFLLMGIPMWVFWGFSEVRDNKDADSPMIRVFDKKSRNVTSVPLEEYLVGVVAAEMPANFEIEALKAQAVAARTYALKRMFAYGAKPVDGHMDGEICTDPTHCQAWNSTGELKEKWGKLRYYIYLEKIKKAVRLTKGQVIAYNKALIEPVYHGSCGGNGTENSEDVWSAEVPYLRGVECSNEYRVEEQVFSKEFKTDEFMALIKEVGVKDKGPIISVTTPSSRDNRVIEQVLESPAGRIKQAQVLGFTVSGTNLRSVLGMTSTYLEWQKDGDKIKFTSTGKGHAVGMCQYGANGMAREGKNYKEILMHYYTGVNLQKFKY